MSRIFGKAVHQAFVVPDMDQALAKMIGAGIGPAFVLRDRGGASRFRGEMHKFMMSAAFIYSGDTLFEFIVPQGEGVSSYHEFLNRHPQGGLHHICYVSTNFEDSIRKAEAAGVVFRIVQEFTTPEGKPFEIYMEPVGVEDAVQIQLLTPGPLDDWFAYMHGIAANWDGSDPIRDASLSMLDMRRPAREPAA